MSQSMDARTVQQAVNVAKSVLSVQDAAQVEKLFSDPNAMQSMAARLSQKDLNTVTAIMQNPAMLKAVLQSPKGREALQRFLHQK